METREEIIKRQTELSKKVENAYNEYMVEYAKMFEYFRKFESDPFFKDLFPEMKTITETNKMLCDMAIHNPIQYRQIDEKIKNHLKEQGIAMFDNNELFKKKYAYYELLIESLNTYCKDQSNLFPLNYQKKIDELADNGYFIYFEETPDFERFLTDNVQDNINFLVSLFSSNECNFLWYNCNLILKAGFASNNITEKNKAHDLQEALMCFENECYSSCARTLLALINNDHNNASNIFQDYFEKGISTGLENSVAITKQLQELDVCVLTNRWFKLDDYYKRIYLNRKKVTSEKFNRHQIIHGNYEEMKMPNKEFCVQLFTFYFSFKVISYYLQQIYDMNKEIEMDANIMSAQAIKNNKNLN